MSQMPLCELALFVWLRDPSPLKTAQKRDALSAKAKTRHMRPRNEYCSTVGGAPRQHSCKIYGSKLRGGRFPNYFPGDAGPNVVGEMIYRVNNKRELCPVPKPPFAKSRLPFADTCAGRWKCRRRMGGGSWMLFTNPSTFSVKRR